MAEFRLIFCWRRNLQVSTFALFHGEVSGMISHWRVILAGWAPHVIVLTGFVSFVLTVLSMHATKFATPLTVSVMGALKQAREAPSYSRSNNPCLGPRAFAFKVLLIKQPRLWLTGEGGRAACLETQARNTVGCWLLVVGYSLFVHPAFGKKPQGRAGRVSRVERHVLASVFRSNTNVSLDFLCPFPCGTTLPPPPRSPQILVVAFSVFKMHRSVTRLNIVGLFLVLVGVVRYTIISRREKRQVREKRGAGLGRKSKAQSEKRNGFAADSSSSASSSLLPTTVNSATIGTSSGGGGGGGDGVMVNGNRAKTRGGGERKVKTVKGEGKKGSAMAWSWWGGKNGDASRRRFVAS